ncbi:MAG: hypothetical protein K2W81_05310 [Sphingomonas sp.]|uniref:hypothetical protein n=1 Tax=Sphingomonas sp. TaxID=28214 RepID=UPI0025ED243A|nr:hypothetical protein [Sphingomonas sp.]MBY0283364.1 hypothetical protein [Sphingomonas sp.]
MTKRTSAMVIAAALSAICVLLFLLYYDHIFAKSSIQKYSRIGDRINVEGATNVWFHHDKGIDVTELITLTETPDDFINLRKSLKCRTVPKNRSYLYLAGRAQLWWWSLSKNIDDKFECDVGNAFIDGAIENISKRQVRVWMVVYTM